MSGGVPGQEAPNRLRRCPSVRPPTAVFVSAHQFGRKGVAGLLEQQCEVLDRIITATFDGHSEAIFRGLKPTLPFCRFVLSETEREWKRHRES